MNSVRSNNISLKYQRFTTLGSKDIGIINSEFVAKTQFLYIEKLPKVVIILKHIRSSFFKPLFFKITAISVLLTISKLTLLSFVKGLTGSFSKACRSLNSGVLLLL